MSDRDPLTRKFNELKPATIRVIRLDDSEVDMRPNGTRKRWVHVIDSLRRMAWREIALLDPKGAVLAMIENPELPSSSAPIIEEETASTDLDRHAQRIIAAQREALTWQDRGVRAALDAMVMITREMAGAIATLSKIHQMQLDNAIEMARNAAADADDAGPRESVPSSALMNALAPALIGKLMQSSPPNGKKE